MYGHTEKQVTSRQFRSDPATVLEYVLVQQECVAITPDSASPGPSSPFPALEQGRPVAVLMPIERYEELMGLTLVPNAASGLPQAFSGSRP
jgi:PHD/YefM family antitoxin component YafN of YafNO toxin-antitoxin module